MHELIFANIKACMRNCSVSSCPEEYNIAFFQLVLGNDLYKRIQGFYSSRQLNSCRFTCCCIDKAGAVKRVRSDCSIFISSSGIFFCIINQCCADFCCVLNSNCLGKNIACGKQDCENYEKNKISAFFCHCSILVLSLGKC